MEGEWCKCNYVDKCAPTMMKIVPATEDRAPERSRVDPEPRGHLPITISRTGAVRSTHFWQAGLLCVGSRANAVGQLIACATPQVGLVHCAL